MPENYYIVDLRCGTCGSIFASSQKPLRQNQADELAGMFREKGPARFVQCKNKCTRQHQFIVFPPETPFKAPENHNQVVNQTLVPHAELKERGFAA